jgi:hypothetical protein
MMKKTFFVVCVADVHFGTNTTYVAAGVSSLYTQYRPDRERPRVV